MFSNPDMVSKSSIWFHLSDSSMKKIIAIVLILVGIVGGGAIGLMLKPQPVTSDVAQMNDAEVEDVFGKPEGPQVQENEKDQTDVVSYVKVGRQTIIPILEQGETKALMMFELAVDVASDQNDRALAMEPRLRDAFLRELFQMSYTGAFDDTFTDDRVIDELRRNLVRAAEEHLGKNAVNDVLILDVMRQNTP